MLTDSDIREQLRAIDAHISQDHFQFVEHNPASLVALAAFELQRNDFAEKVAKLLEDFAYTFAAYDGGSHMHTMQPGEYSLHFGLEVPNYAQPYDLPLKTRALNLTVQTRTHAEAKRIRNKLVDAGLVQGWSGEVHELEEAYSDYGWISVRNPRKEN